VGQLCDNDSSVTFTQDQVTVYKNGKHPMYGTRDPKSRLWRVSLKQKFETESEHCNHAHENYNKKFSSVGDNTISALKDLAAIFKLKLRQDPSPATQACLPRPSHAQASLPHQPKS
jgi:hypothetical protein